MRQLALSMPNTWGGRRPGAGRTRNGPRPGVPHRARPYHDAAHPAHVTLRARAGLPSLRAARVFPSVRAAIRLARAANRTLERTGKVWGDRYHRRDLATPREVRHALVYVLQSFKKHGPAERVMDPCSSAPGFEGWRDLRRFAPRGEEQAVR